MWLVKGAEVREKEKRRNPFSFRYQNHQPTASTFYHHLLTPAERRRGKTGKKVSGEERKGREDIKVGEALMILDLETK